MADPKGPSELIEEILLASRIRDANERAELQRELEAHFADAGDTPESIRAAMERFGAPESVGAALELVHRRSRAVVHLLRLLVTVVVSALVALALQLITNVRLDPGHEAITLGAGFSRSIIVSAIVILVLIAAWELDIESMCARLERHPARLMATVLAFVVVIIGVHTAEAAALPSPGVALTASIAEVAVWTSTIAILARTDRFFARVFASPRE